MWKKGSASSSRKATESVYGMVTAPAQATQAATVEGIPVQERLEYGLLHEGQWTRKTATPPRGVLKPDDT